MGGPTREQPGDLGCTRVLRRRLASPDRRASPMDGQEEASVAASSLCRTATEGNAPERAQWPPRGHIVTIAYVHSHCATASAQLGVQTDGGEEHVGIMSSRPGQEHQGAPHRRHGATAPAAGVAEHRRCWYSPAFPLRYNNTGRF